MTSPQPPNPFSPDNSTFDFLQFMGIDTTTGTSPYSSTEAGPSQPKELDDASRAGSSSSRGRKQIRGGKHNRNARSTSSAHENGMEIDTNVAINGNNNGLVPFGPSQMLGLPKGLGGALDLGLGNMIGQGQGNIEFDASQAQLLQQQVSQREWRRLIDLARTHTYAISTRLRFERAAVWKYQSISLPTDVPDVSHITCEQHASITE